MNKKEEILKAINENNFLSQRDLAKKLTISVGTVNSILKVLVEDGILQYVKFNNRYRYKFTKKGIDYLKNTIEASSEIKIKIPNESNGKVSQAVILAAGNVKDFKKPVGFLKLEENLLMIDRIINILNKNNINDIIIVVGYKSEYYEELSKKYNFKIAYNYKYKWTGTMASLACASKYLKQDFLIIENDVLIEERAIVTLINNSNNDCVLLTTESGSYDEAFVEIKNGFLYRISKDIHALNKIHGELLGVCKISYEVFQKMLEEFSENENPYINYEYVLLNLSRYYNVGYEKIDDLIWFEIDNRIHYDNVKNYVYPTLKRRESQIKINMLKEYIVNVLKVNEASIKEIVPCGGMTNKNYKVTVDEKKYILRIPGNGTEEMIDRKVEKKNIEISSALNIDTKLVYFDDTNGIKISEYINDASTLTGMSAKQESNMTRIVDLIRKLHNSDVEFHNRFDILGKIELYEGLLYEYNGNNYDDYEDTKRDILKIYKYFKNMNIEEKPCHNDTVPENFISSSNNKMYLIDWEYSGMNDPMWDLAALSIECKFSADDEELLVSLYYGEKPTNEIKQRILIHKIMQDFLWALWTAVKEAKGDNFGTYGLDRYKRAKKNIINFRHYSK